MSARYGLVYALCVLFLYSTGCSSGARRLSSSFSASKADHSTASQTIAVAPPAAQGSAQGSVAQSITYASNPERFVKEPTYEPPFNIKNPKTADEHFDVAVDDDNHKQF